ncbi:MAG: hypothetical protein WCX69_01515 [Candidatus Paceibacterota bacterium]
MEEKKEQNESVSARIIGAVKSGEIKMRPKWHFILRATLWTVGIAIVALALVYLASLFVFIMARTGIWIAPVFGLRGLFIFLASLPWLLLTLVALFIIVLEIMVRHYSFAWRQPLVYLTVVILIIVAGGGILIAATPFHSELSHCRPFERPMPSAGGVPISDCGTGIYRDLGPRRFNNIHAGVITELSLPNFTINNRQQERLLILVTRRTRLPFGEDFMVGDAVIVVGERQGDQIEAFGITEVNQ